MLADKFDGKPLNSPERRRGASPTAAIWFTDPPFGILGDYEGTRPTPELPTNVYRLDGQTGRLTVAAGDINRPNGLAFSPDERKLYVVESGVTPRARSGSSTSPTTAPSSPTAACFIDAEPGGTPDGFRVDMDGNLWCGWGMGNAELDGVKVFNPTGKPIGFIALPGALRQSSCFGGAKRNRLFMVTGRSLYSLFVGVSGAV